MAVTPDLNQIAVVMTRLQHNYSQLAQNWFNIFYNENPMEEVTITFFDETGNLEVHKIPNRAFDLRKLTNGSGTPEGNLKADKGVIYQDTENGCGYIKTTPISSNTGWYKILTDNEYNFNGKLRFGSGTPEGNVTGSKGNLYIDESEGTLYIKTTATGNTGWIINSSVTIDQVEASIAYAIATAPINEKVGDLENLTTSYKENIVGAINEVDARTGNLPSMSEASGQFLSNNGTIAQWIPFSETTQIAEIGETNSNEEGYIVYSNGYCVQWGNTAMNNYAETISLFKPFTDTNYQVQLTATSDYTASADYIPSLSIRSTDKAVDAFTILGKVSQATYSYVDGVGRFMVGFRSQSLTNVSWVAYGYIPSTEYTEASYKMFVE